MRDRQKERETAEETERQRGVWRTHARSTGRAQLGVEKCASLRLVCCIECVFVDGKPLLDLLARPVRSTARPVSATTNVNQASGEKGERETAREQ